VSKKRAFDADEVETEEAPASSAPLRTEPTPRGRTAIALVLVSWVLPLGMLVSLFTYAEEDHAVQLAHRALLATAILLLLAGMGLGVRGIDLARKDPRLRRVLAIWALILGVSTPVVWVAEALFGMRVLAVRDRLDAEAAEDAPAGAPTTTTE